MSSKTPPPSYLEATTSSSLSGGGGGQGTIPNDINIKGILRQAFGNCPRKLKALGKMEFLKVEPHPAFWYQMEVLTEERKIKSQSMIYRESEEVDDIRKGQIPEIWDIPVKPMEVRGYHDSASKTIYLPHSEEIVDCKECKGKGEYDCGKCQGKGIARCHFCKPPTQNEGTPPPLCQYCKGRSLITCKPCETRGKLRCPGCKGSGLLKTWKNLNILWQTQRINERCYPSDLDWENIYEGWNLVENKPWSRGDGQLRLLGHDPKVLTVADKAMTSLRNEIESDKVKALRVRQKVYEAEVLMVEFKYGEEKDTGHFYIYGHDRKVHFPQIFRYWTLMWWLVRRMRKMRFWKRN